MYYHTPTTAVYIAFCRILLLDQRGHARIQGQARESAHEHCLVVTNYNMLSRFICVSVIGRDIGWIFQKFHIMTFGLVSSATIRDLSTMKMQLKTGKTLICIEAKSVIQVQRDSGAYALRQLIE